MDTSDKIALWSAIIAGAAFVATCFIGWRTAKKSETANEIAKNAVATADKANELAQRAYDRQFVPNLEISHGIAENRLTGSVAFYHIGISNHGLLAVHIERVGYFAEMVELSRENAIAISTKLQDAQIDARIIVSDNIKGMFVNSTLIDPQTVGVTKWDDLPVTIEPGNSAIFYANPEELLPNLARERASGISSIRFGAIDAVGNIHLSREYGTENLLADYGFIAHKNRNIGMRQSEAAS